MCAITAAPGSSLAASSVAAPPAPLCGDGPLEILLTNDDGAGAAGIRALRAGLLAAGHRVTLAAPDHNASGSSMSFSWRGATVKPDPDDPSVFAIAASPATTVVLGATALFPPGHRPDLVISGINDGANAGGLLLISGTLGAALAGTMLLDPPIPGVAVSAERLHGNEPVDSVANRAQLDAVGAHVARLLGATRGWFCERGRVVRARTVLNVNYPGLPVSDLRGVVVARQGTAADLRVSFVAGADGAYSATTSRTGEPDARGTDRDWLAQGRVTITPVSGVIGDDSVPERALKRRLRRF